VSVGKTEGDCTGGKIWHEKTIRHYIAISKPAANKADSGNHHSKRLRVLIIE
jgi:hypothetical protein